MNLISRISLGGMAVCAMAFCVSNSWGQSVTTANRMASIRNQQAAQQTALARQQVAQRAAYQRALAQRTNAQRTGTAQRNYGVTSVGRGNAGVRSTASGASLVGLRSAFGAFSVDMGRMPTAAEGLAALLYRPPGAKNWRGPYISQVNWHPALTDPWGNAYRYYVTGTGRYQMHTISSDGPDRTVGTADDLQVQF